MVCRCRDGTYGPECCSKGGRSSRKGKSKTSPAAPYLGATPGKVATKTGDMIITYGKIQQAEALTARHPIEGKIWTQYSRKELRQQRSRTGNTKIDRKVKAYDARPERFTGPQKKHWQRRPMKGIYSSAKPGQVRMYRAKKFAQASGIRGTGHLMKGLGYFYYGYLGYRISKEPKKAISLALTFTPTHMMATEEQQEVVEHVADSAMERYLTSWARVLSPN